MSDRYCSTCKQMKARDQFTSENKCRSCRKEYDRSRAIAARARSVGVRPTAKMLEGKYVPVTESGCWIWTSCISYMGYGYLTVVHHGRKMFAHRVSWEVSIGPIPEGMFVCHKCDTPLCINPDHLFLGTHAQNMADMRRKGRAWYQNLEKKS